VGGVKAGIYQNGLYSVVNAAVQHVVGAIAWVPSSWRLDRFELSYAVVPRARADSAGRDFCGRLNIPCQGHMLGMLHPHVQATTCTDLGVHGHAFFTSFSNMSVALPCKTHTCSQSCNV
jgi:hypothetical protein